jgi:hypothetical protein
LVALGERYGNDLSDSIKRTGEVLQRSLQQVTTQRQLAGLGASLSTLNPQTPDYPQQLIALGSQYPFAMQDPRGQALMMIGAKSHAQWQQLEAVKQRQQTGFGNQVALENLRYRHTLGGIEARNESKVGQEVDLSALGNGLPRRDVPLPSLDAAANEPVTDEQAPLFGMGEGLGSMSSALGPLRDAQLATGVKPNRAQVFGAIAAERTRAQAAKMQEDRQAEAEKLSAAKDQARAKADETKAAQAEARQQRLILQGQINTIERDITQHRAALNKHLAMRQKVLAAGDEAAVKEFDAQRAELESVLEQAGAERTQLLQQINNLGKDTEEVPAPVSAIKAVRKYNPATGTFQ